MVRIVQQSWLNFKRGAEQKAKTKTPAPDASGANRGRGGRATKNNNGGSTPSPTTTQPAKVPSLTAAAAREHLRNGTCFRCRGKHLIKDCLKPAPTPLTDPKAQDTRIQEIVDRYVDDNSTPAQGSGTASEN